MRILYGANNNIDSNRRLAQFINHSNNVVVKIAAYYKNHEYLDHIDWALDAIHTKSNVDRNSVCDLFGTTDVPMVDFKRISWVFDELVEWMPDLVISDCEPITAHIAKTMGIELWYCSPMLQLTGIEWKTGQAKMLKQISSTKSKINRLPKASKYLVYSPFCDISGPTLKDGFEWVKPYHEALDVIPHKCIGYDPPKEILDLFPGEVTEVALTTGETSYLSEIIYGGLGALVIGNAECPEAILNAELCRLYGVGDNLGKITKKSFDRVKKQIQDTRLTYQINEGPWGTLHRKVIEHDRSKECSV
jgi:hypothetical protein